MKKNQKTIDELNLENVKCTILTEDKSSKIIDDKLEIRVKNILEWLI
jgi:hypothetical protein